MTKMRDGTEVNGGLLLIQAALREKRDALTDLQNVTKSNRYECDCLEESIAELEEAEAFLQKLGSK